MRRLAAVVVMVVSLSACSFVKLTPEGEQVRVMKAEEVTKCERKGKTTVSVLSKIAGGDRIPEQVQEELNVMARNSAPDLQGDTVVPITPVKDGKQTFAVYRCIPR